MNELSYTDLHLLLAGLFAVIKVERLSPQQNEQAKKDVEYVSAVFEAHGKYNGELARAGNAEEAILALWGRVLTEIKRRDEAAPLGVV